MQFTVNITDEQVAALNAALEIENARIDAFNRRVQADKDMAASHNVPYSGPEPMEPLLLEQLIQMRFDDRVAQDVRERARTLADTMANTFLKADPQTQASMLADWSKYNPITPGIKPGSSRK